MVEVGITEEYEYPESILKSSSHEILMSHFRLLSTSKICGMVLINEFWVRMITLLKEERHVLFENLSSTLYVTYSKYLTTNPKYDVEECQGQLISKQQDESNIWLEGWCSG